MSNYVKTTDFAAKDTLATANPGKIIKGAEFEVEFDALAVAVNSKADENNAALTGTATAVNLDVSGTLDVQGTLQVGSVSITASAAEINFLDGVTSAIQTQLDARYESGDTLEAASGTASAPGLAFASDTNTGFFRQGADSIGASLGGTERVRFNTEGLRVTSEAAGWAFKYDGTSKISCLKFYTDAESAITVMDINSGLGFGGNTLTLLDEAWRFQIGGGTAIEFGHNGSNAIINVDGLPTSAAGLSTGDLWNDSGTLKIA